VATARRRTVSALSAVAVAGAALVVGFGAGYAVRKATSTTTTSAPPPSTTTSAPSSTSTTLRPLAPCSGAALTGENTADYLAPGATELTFHESNGLKYKITPAGRYTVSVGFDPSYGETLDVNEIQGKDWDIAIHKVWLGAPAEHREARLRSRALAAALAAGPV